MVMGLGSEWLQGALQPSVNGRHVAGVLRSRAARTGAGHSFTDHKSYRRVGTVLAGRELRRRARPTV
jgi:hypothetical protein